MAEGPEVVRDDGGLSAQGHIEDHFQQNSTLDQSQSQSQSQAQSQSQSQVGPIDPQILPQQQQQQPVQAFRKQNVACDACRAKKIRCQRTSTTEVCGQCAAKGAECVSHYIEQLQGKAKKPKEPRKKRKISEDQQQRNVETPEWGSSSLAGPAKLAWEQLQADSDILSRRLPSECQRDLLRYLFAPSVITHHHYGYNDLSSLRQCDAGDSDLWEEMGGAVWSEPPSAVHSSLTEQQTKVIADDLVETFFAFAHSRFSMFDPVVFRERFADPDNHAAGPLPHHHIACALAFGARFSDSQTLAEDREEVSARDVQHAQGRTRCRIAQLMVVRAREVAEVLKVWRQPKIENIQTCIMMEMLLGQMAFRRTGFIPYYTTAAVRHAIALGLNTRSALLAMPDDQKRTESVYLWWLTLFSDAIIAAWYRHKSMLADSDLVSDASGPLPNAGVPLKGQMTEGGEQSPEWFAAAHFGSAMVQRLCDGLWSPSAQDKGIATPVLVRFVEMNIPWKKNYGHLGVPKQWPEDWDFFAAISACVNDAYYHGMWLLVHRAVCDFGLVEGNGVDKPWSAELLKAHQRVEDEAKHAAMRIAALVAVLTENGYLRLDPIIIYHPIYQAGHYLAAAGRPEHRACVAGLKQFAITYPAIWDVAEEIEATYRAKTEKVSLVQPPYPPPQPQHLSAGSNSNTNSGVNTPSTTTVGSMTGPGPSVNGMHNPGSGFGSGPTSFVGVIPVPDHLYYPPQATDWNGTSQSQSQSQAPMQQSQYHPYATASSVPGVPLHRIQERWNVNRANNDILSGHSFHPVPPHLAQRNVWPEGSGGAPSRDVAWTLFDWLQQDERQPANGGGSGSAAQGQL